MNIKLAALSVLACLYGANVANAAEDRSPSDPISQVPQPKGAQTIDLEKNVIIDEEGNEFPFETPASLETKRESRSAKMGLSSLEDYVLSYSMDGMPYHKVSQFQGEDLTRIKKMLHDPKWQEHWERMARAVGMLGDKADAKFLIDYIEKFDDQSERAELAKLSALESLGFMVARHQDKDALAYLKKGASPLRWKGIASRYGSDGGLFALYALNGLSYSGDAEAIEFLEGQRRLRLAAPSAKPSEFAGTASIAAIDELLKQARAVQVHGPEYDNREAGVESESADDEVRVMH